MARLRIRVELNRGGVGVPLHKLASVVTESERFFQMLADDVHIQKERGEWLAFDFDHESLNFTAEYVGPVSAEQVGAFANAFSGTSSLRRAAIGQFTRIADAIGEDELIGFGLYHSDQEIEPGEWRCLSRRDALRISDEIQILMGAVGADGTDTHLPSVSDPSISERLFRDRRDRAAAAAAQANLPGLVREVEANLTKRISGIEGEVQSNTRMIQDMRQTTAVTEDSFRSLLAAVDTFCSQATRQLERLSVPAQLAEPPRSALPSRSWGTAIAVGIVVLGILSASYVLWPSKTPGTVSAKQPVTVNAASLGEQPKTAHELLKPDAAAPVEQRKRTAHELLKPNATTPVEQPKTAREQLASNGAALVEQSKPTAHEPVAAAIPETPKPGVMTVHLEASEPAWVSVTDGGGTKLFSKVLQAGESQSLGLTQTATLRTGNAGGLAVQFNGQPIGALGPQGKVREILFQDGTYKVLGSAR
jgi:hypothetical protein